uniref:NBS-LRR type resistance protein n=1 Tax=Cucumis melo TaxID=3656 RepID=A0A9I9E9P1_CUCME
MDFMVLGLQLGFRTCKKEEASVEGNQDMGRKHKENQTRPYGLHASFLPLVGLPLAVPLPAKLKKKKSEYKIYPNALINLVIPKDARISLVIPKDTPISLVIPRDAHISLVLPKDARISLVLPKDTHISLVLPKDAHIRKILTCNPLWITTFPASIRGPVVGKPLPDTWLCPPIESTRNGST